MQINQAQEAVRRAEREKAEREERARDAEEREAERKRFENSNNLNLVVLYHMDPKSGIKLPSIGGFNINPDKYGIGMKRTRPQAQVEELAPEDTEEETKEEVLSEA